MKNITRFFALIFIIIFASNPAHAVLQIDITKGSVNPLPIALPDLVGGSPADQQIGADIMQVVAADLERSGLFKPIDKKSYIQQITAQNVAAPSFADWRQIDAQALATGTITRQPGGKLQVEFRLYDVLSGQQIAGKSFGTLENNWRRVSHLMADEIYKRLTGEDGYFDSRIVYVSESGPGKTRVKRLAIMDQDGANHKFLTNGRDLVLTPRFSPSSQKIAYLSYAGKRPRVYIRDIETGQEQLLGDFPGMSFAPRFAPDGSKVLMSVSANGNSDIYIMDLASRGKTRITSGDSINTSPSFSPDEKMIVFNSDRGGSQQLYTMTSSGGNVQRISFGDGKYGTPVWSPRGDLIAFTKMHGGKFYIGVMRPDGSGERMLTESYLDEGPTWSPNGRVIIFTRQSPSYGGRAGASKLFSIDLTGYNEREIVTPTDASDPAWSPLLK